MNQIKSKHINITAKLVGISVLFIILFAAMTGSTSLCEAVETSLPTIPPDIVALRNLKPSVTVDDSFDDDKLIITLTEEFSEINQTVSLSDFSGLDVEVLNNISDIEDLTYLTNSQAIASIDEYNQILQITLEEPSKQNVLNAIEAFEELSIVIVAEPVYQYEIENDYIPNDVEYNNGHQWGLNGTNGIHMEGAWDYTNGTTNPKIKVGIMESGLSIHDDLSITSGMFIPFQDDIDHGTHVAGIIGAKADNSDGIAGIAQVDIALLNSSTFIGSIIWAMNNDVKIINGSFGYRIEELDNLYLLPNIFHYFILKDFAEYGGIYIASAGNQNRNTDTDTEKYYPAGYGNPENLLYVSNVISVGSLTSAGQRASSSNYGDASVQIYAPGANIYSTLPNNTYGLKSGTSMAAPHVAGVAALLLSMYPDLTGVEIKDIILNSADTITISTPDGNQTVKKLNAENAVKYLFDQQKTVNNSVVTASGQINADSDFFKDKTYITEINLTNGSNNLICVSVNADYAIDTVLYNSDFEEVELTIRSYNSGKEDDFAAVLPSGRYYLWVRHTSDSGTGNVSVSIDGRAHTHSYTRISSGNRLGHTAICVCGASTIEAHTYHHCVYVSNSQHQDACICGRTISGTLDLHTIMLGTIVNNQSNCIYCGGLIDLRYTDTWSIAKAVKVTVNGSYITESGIVVLAEADLEAYENGTLIFYYPEDLPVTE